MCSVMEPWETHFRLAFHEVCNHAYFAYQVQIGSNS